MSIRKLKEIHSLTHPAKLDKPGKDKSEEPNEPQPDNPIVVDETRLMDALDAGAEEGVKLDSR